MVSTGSSKCIFQPLNLSNRETNSRSKNIQLHTGPRGKREIIKKREMAEIKKIEKTEKGETECEE